MNKNFIMGISLSIFNLLFYATFLDILFHSGIFPLLFGVDLLKVFGKASTSVGIGAITIAIFLELISYRVIRRSTIARSETD
jgi:hypothetical protein